MDTEFVCSVEKENKSGVYRLHTKWEDSKFKLNVASKDASWTGEMTPDRVDQMSRLLEMNPDSYLEDCKTSLTTNDGKPGLVYAVEDGHFVWKRVEDEDTGVKIKMGKIPLEPTNFVETIQEMMNVALNANKNLMRRLAQTDDEKLQAESNITKLLEKLAKHEQTTTEMETELMTQFLTVLNAKKSKISQLKEELLMTKAGNIHKRARCKKSADDFGGDTDDDEEAESPKKKSPAKKKRPAAPIPSLKAMIDAQSRQ